MDFPERDFEFEDSSETSDHQIDTSGEEEEAGDIVEAWLSGQTWYLLAGLLMGFVFNMVSRLTAVQRVASSSPATAGPTAGNAASLWTSNFVSSNYPRMCFVVRTDLKMGGGKIASQTAHAAIMCYKKAARECPALLRGWEAQGQPKIVLKAQTHHDLVRIEAEAREAGIVTAIVRDAGHTQVTSGTATVLGMGPAPSEVFSKITGKLKLL